MENRVASTSIKIWRLGLDNWAVASVHGVDAMEREAIEIAGMPLARVLRMHIPALQRIHRTLFGKDGTVLHIVHLRRKVAWELQARAEGGLPEEARQHALAIAWQSTLRTRGPERAPRLANSTLSLGHDPRLPPPGTLLRRECKGKSVLVKVLPGGFEYEQRIFPSLSAIAKLVSGTNWNGFLFFGLTRDSARGR